MDAYYVNLISKLREAIKQKRRKNLRKGSLLHHSNGVIRPLK